MNNETFWLVMFILFATIFMALMGRSCSAQHVHKCKGDCIRLAPPDRVEQCLEWCGESVSGAPRKKGSE